MRTGIRVILEVTAAAAMLVGVALVALNYANLPEIIPIHFGISGKADGFGSQLWLPVLPGLSVVIYTIMWLAQRNPQKSNTPWKITDENRERQYKLIVRLLTWLKAENAILFAYLQWAMIQVAFGGATGISSLFMCLWAASLLLTMGAYFYSGYRAR